MVTAQPKWKFLANLGDADPLANDGLFLYVDETGVYSPELERLALHYESANAEEGERKYLIHRICLDTLKIVVVPDADNPNVSVSYLVPAAWDTSWPYPGHQYDEWFHEDLSSVADTMDTTVEALRAAFTSDDPKQRAWAYQRVADHHGWENFDSYPLECSEKEVLERYTLGELD